jgi:hypothetical protein
VVNEGRNALIIITVFFLVVLILSLANKPSPQNIDLLSGVGIDISPNMIDWGTLHPGESRNSTLIQVYNTGSRPVTLTFNCSGFIPAEAERYLNMTWDYANETVDREEQIDVTFTLTVARNITVITDFSFNVTVYGR